MLESPLIWEQTHNAVFIKASDSFSDFIRNNDSFEIKLQFHTTDSTKSYIVLSENIIEGETFYEKPLNLDVNFFFTSDQALLFKLSFQ